jgi:hypothetical protein
MRQLTTAINAIIVDGALIEKGMIIKLQPLQVSPK